MIVIASFIHNLREEYLLWQSRLAAEGIPFTIQNEHTLGLFPQLQVVMGGLKIAVPDEFVARATEIYGEILDEVGAEVALSDEEFAAEAMAAHSDEV